MTNKFKNLLNEHLLLLENAAKILQYSYNKVKNIAINEDCGQVEIDQLELLASRFSRLSDILIKKYLDLLKKLI